MNYMKKLLALVLVCTMIIPMGMISAFAMDVDASVSANWNAMAAKYSKGTWNIIAPKASGNAIKTDGFEFKESENGGIKVITPDYETFAGTYGVSAVTSNTKTSLDGLSVVITPDEYDSMIDSLKSGNTIGVLWTEEKVEQIASMSDPAVGFDQGLFTAVRAYDTGLRHLIPTAKDAVPKTPASDPTATPVGKALYISVTCNVAQENNAPIATSVKITYYDGYYMNDDGNPGYRWIFTARNHPDTLNSDATRLSQPWEAVDLSKGLAVNVRADEEHGFIVNVNGYDYYKGEDVGYFPDAKQDWYGYKTGDLTDDKIEESDPLYLETMTYARDDVDLSGLKSAGDGYVTIGAISNNDSSLDDHRCNYTIDTINGTPAATWKGEATPEHECIYRFVETVPASCTRGGYDYLRCSICGMAKTENYTEATGHTSGEMKEFEAPACDNYGTMAAHCLLCRRIVDSYAIPKIEHSFTDEDEIITVPTCNSEGIVKKHCTSCAKDYEFTIPADESAHNLDSVTPIIETINGSTDWYGKIEGNCNVCGADAGDTVNMYDYVEHFTDVKENHWFMSEVAYCVKQGYVSGMTETTFVPNGNLTRAQFLTLLAAVDGVDLDQYEGKNAGFEDVKTSHWWNKVICWAVENEYTAGISPTKFGPNNQITRSQLARFFYVYTEKKGLDVSKQADLTAFTDAGKVQEWALTPVKWAVAESLISGTTATTLAPNGTATRAQAARIIMLYTNVDFVPVKGDEPCAHEWGEWEVTVEPTYETEGSQTRTCGLCGETETEIIPVLSTPEDLPVYDESATPEFLAVGTGDYDLLTDHQYTILAFESSESGSYTITANDSLIGIVSYNGMWVTVIPDVNTVAESTLTWNCTGAGQSIWLAVKGGKATANITVAYTNVDTDPEPVVVDYVNIVSPKPFSLDGATTLINIAYNDDIVDTAVLGEDDLYHLNSATGPIIYVDLDDAKIAFAVPEGPTSTALMPNHSILSVLDTESNVKTVYSDALAEYLNAADENKLYPLTIDLMTMYKEISEYKRIEWFDGTDFISPWLGGGFKEDSWMFACYYIPEK